MLAMLKGSTHLVTDLKIDLDGDKATGTARWVMILPGPKNRPRVAATGHYKDTMVREDGRWKYAKRLIYGNIPFGDPLAEK